MCVGSMHAAALALNGTTCSPLVFLYFAVIEFFQKPRS